MNAKRCIAIDRVRPCALLIILALGIFAILGSSDGGGGGGGGGDDDGEVTVRTWRLVGTQVSPATAESEDATMLVVNGQPAVGYREASFEANLNLWSGSSWGIPVADPTSGNMSYTAYHAPSFCSGGTAAYLAYSLAGVSGVAFDEFYDRVFSRYWTGGAAWSVPMNGGEEISVKSTSAPAADAWEPAVACSTTGEFWVAWIENDVGGTVDDDDLWVARVTASSAERSTPLSRNNVAGSYGTDVKSAAVAANAAGTVYVALWEAHHTDQYRTDLYVSEYSSGVFTSLGGPISDDYDGNNLSKPSIAFIGGDLYVAYSRANSTDNTRHVYVKKYSGGIWSVVGGGPVSAYSASDHYDSGHPDLMAVGGDLYLAWDEADQYDGPFVYVARLTPPGDTWEIIGDRLNVDRLRSALDPSLAYAPSDSSLYVAFEENVAGWYQIFVKKTTID